MKSRYMEQKTPQTFDRSLTALDPVLANCDQLLQ